MNGGRPEPSCEPAARGRIGRRSVTGILAFAAGLWLNTTGVMFAAAATPAAPARPSGAGVEHFAIVPGASTVTYHVGETFFAGNRFNVAVGTTHAIQGDAYVDRAHPARSRLGPVTVDISTFQSDSDRRDRAIRGHWLESSKYPTAEFTATEIRGLPASYTDGQSLPVQILGNLRVRDVTKPVAFAGTVKLTGETLSGTLRTSVWMTDFGFDPPQILTLKTENQVRLELQFTAQRVGA